MRLPGEQLPNPLALSVVICTRNRAAILRNTLARLCACEQPPLDRWELIVADNNSNDATRETVELFRGVLPVVLESVKTPGKSNALNRALELARADNVVFLDDDVLPDWRILRTYTEAFDAFPDVNLFGGRIDLALPEKYDRDLVELPQARLVLPQSNFGTQIRELHYPETPAGPNMAIRRSGLGHDLRFDFTPLRGYGFTVEDTLFFKRFMLSGQRVVYLPAARVGHLVRTEQLSLDYFRERYCFFKLVQPLMDEIPPAKHLFGVPRYLLRQLAACSATYVANTFSSRRTRLCSYLELVGVWRSIADKRR